MKLNTDISNLVPFQNRIRIRISILAWKWIQMSDNSDIHIHISTPTSACRAGTPAHSHCPWIWQLQSRRSPSLTCGSAWCMGPQVKRSCSEFGACGPCVGPICFPPWKRRLAQAALPGVQFRSPGAAMHAWRRCCIAWQGTKQTAPYMPRSQIKWPRTVEAVLRSPWDSRQDLS